MDRIINSWEGCYPSSWRGVIVPEAITHPAKYSSRLIRKIYQHMLDEGWVKKGDHILDPFGGVALGALDSLRLGLNWHGIELEPKFHGIGNDNISFWNRKFGKMPGWGTAELLQGDSRFLLKVLRGEIQASVSSPPYGDDAGLAREHMNKEERVARARELGISNAENLSPIDMEKNGQRTQGNYGSTEGQLGKMDTDGFMAAISSPPFLQSEGGGKLPSYYDHDPGLMARHAAGNKSSDAYGTSEGQLSSMKDGGFDGAISSPPYAETILNYKKNGMDYKRPYMDGQSDDYGETDGQLGAMKNEGFDAAVSSPPFQGSTADGGYQLLGKYAEEGKLTVKQVKGKKDKAYPSWNKDRDTEYAPSPENLGNLEGGDFEAAVSSPPYEATQLSGGGGIANEMRNTYREGQNYGDASGQLGATMGDDFWMASRAIVEQVYLALSPGGHAVFVLKDYVKKGQIVPFCDQWRQLCEAVGFVTLHEHHAMLTRK